MRRLVERIAPACIASHTRHLNRLITRIYDQALRPHDITISQFGLLGAIELLGPVQASEIVECLGLEKSTVSRNVRLLIARNWLQAREAEDGRARLLELTQKGRNLFVKAAPAWERAQKQTLARLGRDSGALLSRLLNDALAE